MNSVERLVAVIASFVRLHGLAPDEARMTLPVLTVSGTDQSLAVAYYLGEPFPSQTGAPRRICFPFVMVAVNVTSMDVTAHKISPRDFGMEIPEGQYVGDLGDLRKLSVKEYRETRAKYDGALSIVIDQRWLTEPAKVRVGEAEVAGGLASALSFLQEKPLRPFYAVVGADLEDWLRRFAPSP